MKKKKKFILWFNEIGLSDLQDVGGKNASLGEMYCQLKKKGIQVPYGFAITSEAFRYIIETNQFREKLTKIFSDLDTSNPTLISKAGKKARELFLNCEIPNDLKNEISKAYIKLSKLYKEKASDVAVRSSATAEDLPEASFAGQHESYLNIKGADNLISTIKKCFASLFKDRAIAYRTENNIDHLTCFLSIGVQKMIRSDIGCSGVIFTLDTESGFRDVVFITASYGLGENIVQGNVDPDEFFVFKPSLKKKKNGIINKIVGEKATKIVYNKSLKQPIKKISTPKNERTKFCLDDVQVNKLAKWAIDIEDHYSKQHKKWTPVDIEFAVDGKTKKIYIVQARPETAQSKKNPYLIEQYSLGKKGKLLTTGKSVGNKIGQGKVRIIREISQMHLFQKGEVLVTEMTNPDWVPIMRIASAIVTDRGGRTSHAAIVSRELGLPCIVGTDNATHILKTGQQITVDCTAEEKGAIYEGLLPIKIEKIDIKSIPETKTKILMNIGQPDDAFRLSFLPCKGIGLARLEFIISQHIKVHPMALIFFENVTDKKTRKEIEDITSGYKNKKQFFIDKLSMGISMIAAAFYPREVILRFSDFKTNEYFNLIGGEYFEPKEENPMIGWRGASRYYKTGYKEGFALECAAVKKVREVMGLDNLKVMIPVCRTPEEGKKVLSVMKKCGLKQGKNGLEIYVMCEIPSNVILAEEFSEIFDGMSIGSNDLTQMVLAVDRDNSQISDLFNENHPAVKNFIKHVIQVANKKKCQIGICGEAPSVYPEFAKFLVECGINSISVSPDAVIKTILSLAKQDKN